MAIPSGSGTEVLKRVIKNGVTDWVVAIDGVANHVYTILSIICCNQASNGTVSIRIDDGVNADNYILDQAPCNTAETYVWNDKFVISGTDELDIKSSQNSDWVITYIDQDWS